MAAKRFYLAAALLVANGALYGSVASADGGAAECAAVTASTRLEAYGYTHVVTLANHCQAPVSCEVWTNVDPSPHVSLRAGPGESVDTVTRRGSPSRAVQAGKQCRFGS